LPLSEKARVEVYLPDLPTPSYQSLLKALDQEFTYTFGGCTIIRGLDGSYLSKLGLKMQDRINLIYTDPPFAFEENFLSLSRYTDQLRAAAFEALEEEAILVVVFKVHHSE
jgi:16S rRNA G966 N2-methylase RsmD